MTPLPVFAVSSEILKMSTGTLLARASMRGPSTLCNILFEVVAGKPVFLDRSVRI